MKIASFESAGRQLYGLLDGACYRVPDAPFLQRHPDLASVLQSGALQAFSDAARTSGTSVALADARALPVIPAPGKVICVGLNYKSHVVETRRDDSPYPALFTRFADSLAAAGSEVQRPTGTARFDWEGELAFIIGRGGRRIARKDALDHVAGYACFNDFSVRDWQRHTHQWTPGKNFPGTGALGPWLVTTDEVSELAGRTLETRVDGEVMQHAPLSDLIFDIPFLVEYISAFTPLSPGDVIATGTPGGVGDRREPPRYLEPGQRVEVEITGLGVLANSIVQEPAA